MGGNDYPQVKDLQGIPFHQPLRLHLSEGKKQGTLREAHKRSNPGYLVETPRKINIETVCEGSGVSSKGTLRMKS